MWEGLLHPSTRTETQGRDSRLCLRTPWTVGSFVKSVVYLRLSGLPTDTSICPFVISSGKRGRAEEYSGQVEGGPGRLSILLRDLRHCNYRRSTAVLSLKTRTNVA